MTPADLESLVAVVRQREPRAYLEIGAGRGETFHAIVSAMPVGSRAVAVEQPELPEDDRCHLVATTADLSRKGYDVYLTIGNSQAAWVIEEVAGLGPFDLAFIDGDDTPRGVAADWIHYGADAVAVAMRTSEFWRTLRAGHDHDEFGDVGVAYKCVREIADERSLTLPSKRI